MKACRGINAGWVESGCTDLVRSGPGKPRMGGVGKRKGIRSCVPP